jgi:hypothetical protein
MFKYIVTLHKTESYYQWKIIFQTYRKTFHASEREFLLVKHFSVKRLVYVVCLSLLSIWIAGSTFISKVSVTWRPLTIFLGEMDFLYKFFHYDKFSGVLWCWCSVLWKSWTCHWLLEVEKWCFFAVVQMSEIHLYKSRKLLYDNV